MASRWAFCFGSAGRMPSIYFEKTVKKLKYKHDDYQRIKGQLAEYAETEILCQYQNWRTRCRCGFLYYDSLVHTR